ncbi:MAG: PilW family protein [Gammaproteobacteria bacterium]|nr:PilW family protein [Gammaproteobacteria bacterium]MCK5091141.1 PilW family protein [Gammaproteobacteria bacterium]
MKMTTHHTSPCFASQQGFSLVELMVAITLSLILLAGTIEIFSNSKQAYRTTEAFSRLQENGRYAMDILTKDIRMADYQGCAGSSGGSITNTVNCPDGSTRPASGTCASGDDASYNMNTGIGGYDNVAGTITINGASIPAIAGTDVITFRRNADNGISVIKNNSSAQIFVEVTSEESGACDDGTDRISGLCEGDILMVSDCSKSRVFQVANLTITGGAELNATHPASGTPGNTPSSWGGASGSDDEKFGPDSQIIKIENYTYYIGTGASGLNALFRKIGSDASEELVEGVQDMQIQYGEDTDSPVDGSANTYVVVGSVTDMDNAVSVRLSLLLESIDDNIADTAQVYTYNGGSTTAGDRRIRQVFNTTIAIRNRVQ